MEGFGKALDAVRDSDDSVFVAEIFAQAKAFTDAYPPTVARPARVLHAQRESLRAAVPSRTDFLKR